MQGKVLFWNHCNKHSTCTIILPKHVYSTSFSCLSIAILLCFSNSSISNPFFAEWAEYFILCAISINFASFSWWNKKTTKLRCWTKLHPNSIRYGCAIKWPFYYLTIFDPQNGIGTRTSRLKFSFSNKGWSNWDIPIPKKSSIRKFDFSTAMYCANAFKSLSEEVDTWLSP